MTIVFAVCFVVGLVGLLGTFVVGEVGDIGGGHGDGLPFLSLTTIATAAFGFGAGGWLAALLDAHVVVAFGAAVVGAAVLVLLVRGLLLPYLLRQQSNSHIGRASYIGGLGRVTLEISAQGWGEISFVDSEGTRVQARAINSGTGALAAGTTVYIADVDEEYLHVVAVDDAI